MEKVASSLRKRMGPDMRKSTIIATSTVMAIVKQATMATHCTVTIAVDLADFSVCWLLIVARAELVAVLDVIALEDLTDW